LLLLPRRLLLPLLLLLGGRTNAGRSDSCSGLRLLLLAVVTTPDDGRGCRGATGC